MISVENLSKSFGGNLLFERIGFKINSRERIGLVGRNGHGKTTLLRILTGDERPDDGQISLPKHYRIGYVRQNINFQKETILEECMTGLVESEKDHDWKAEKILAGLGFSETDMQKHPDYFSGGYQVRLNLAKVLVSEPDLLLLDEPTNYLDITSIRWIRKFLCNWPHELLLVTHDRGFMDQVVTHTIGIHRKKIRKMKGNTEKFYSQLAQEEEIYEKTRLNDEKRQKEMELFISRFRAKARLANMVQSRIKTLSKQGEKEKLEKIKILDFSFKSKEYRGKTLMQCRNLAFGYDQDKPLFDGLNIHIESRDRICIVGKNGKGKTTLLRLLSKNISPLKGEVVFNPGVEFGLFEQTNISSLDDSKTVAEEILYTHPGVDQQIARNISGAMMFQGDEALKKISVLSGGEKSRVMLGKLLVTPVNLLLLDEPTNHLDMESCDALLAAIDSFQGAVIMVTHNEMFLHALAEKLIVFQQDGALFFDGTYQEFLEKRGWADEMENSGISSGKDAENIPAERLTKKEIRRRRSEIIQKRAIHTKPIEKRIQLVENQIEQNEKELEQHNHWMQEASQRGDGGKIASISKQIHLFHSEIDRLFDELEKLTEQLEEENSPFNQELERLDQMEI
ncbi:MAG: ATP-binding cassette domain-containing protein [Deltaproteobacteria bacterium]|nr:MAG: ATP-binding cassette domain-containing protein [Deltaproteobacteria bacterium]